MDDPLELPEVFLYGCANCGNVHLSTTEIEDQRFRGCRVCIAGVMRPIQFVAQHEGRVRVKLELKS